MLGIHTIQHFDSIASTWNLKTWVNSIPLNRKISRFVKETENHAGLRRKRHKSALYLGIGTGALFRYLARYHIAGVDAARDMLVQCPEGVIQILSKVESLPFLMDDQFHLAFSRNLLKHCVDPLEAIREMYVKTRRGHTAIAIESVVLTKGDRAIPTALVRMTDPSHPPFLTVSEIVELFEKASFSRVEYSIVYHRSAWLRRWVEAEQASHGMHQAILDLYRTAPKSFKERHRVVIERDEITSTVPWLMVRAMK